MEYLCKMINVRHLIKCFCIIFGWKVTGWMDITSIFLKFISVFLCLENSQIALCVESLVLLLKTFSQSCPLKHFVNCTSQNCNQILLRVFLPLDHHLLVDLSRENTHLLPPWWWLKKVETLLIFITIGSLNSLLLSFF